MGSVGTAVAFTLLLGTVTAGLDSGRRVPVFLNKEDASQVIYRQKRAGEGDQQPSNLERECLEKVCNYDEALRFFQDPYRTDIFWSVYIDGDQCAEKPCKNGAMCLDSVGGYDCVCKSGFSGVHCESDQTVCVADKTKGCSQFCKPGYQSYECSCARGWKLQDKDKEKCVPAVTFPCGKVSNPNQWDNRKSANIRSGYQGLPCNSEECPWQALLRNSESTGFCGGVILKENLILTTAQCVSKYSEFHVAVGKKELTIESGEQTLSVKNVHVHPHYVDGRPDNDLAVVELASRIIFKKGIFAACLPERDFADSLLMTGESMGMVTGWKEVPDSDKLQNDLTLNHLSYQPLSQCVESFPGQMTNKMACTMPREKSDCVMSAGSPVLTMHRDVLFLTGVISRSPALNCRQGYVMQKVSRYTTWLKPLMDIR
ncbi:protein Z, vitamin K-dependent plasma glycoprotein a [Denticeps clupeoides]|uniref:Uncharacterized protein n=1 Tax=Denticeps clupeoides TaxID=299321 RepID=A0AAY4AZC2_9TELE|nr:coagulation factor X-like [Denticeps clupeoides]